MWEMLILHPLLWGMIIVISAAAFTFLVFRDFWIVFGVGAFIFIFLAGYNILPEAYSIVVMLFLALVLGIKTMSILLPSGSGGGSV